MKSTKRNTWQLQTAKAQFSEVVRRALTEGPQHITRRGKEEVVVVPIDQFERLSKAPKKKSLVEILRDSPFAKYGVKIERDRTSPGAFPRDIKL